MMKFPSPVGVRPLTQKYKGTYILLFSLFPSPVGVRPLTRIPEGIFCHPGRFMFPSPVGVRPLTRPEEYQERYIIRSFRPLLG